MQQVTEQKFLAYSDNMFEGWEIDYTSNANEVILYSDRADRVVVHHTGDIVAPYRLSAEVKEALLELFC